MKRHIFMRVCLFFIFASLLFSCKRNEKSKEIKVIQVIENVSDNYKVLSEEKENKDIMTHNISETNDFFNFQVIIDKIDYSHIININNFTVKFATQTADIKIYENEICIIEKDFVSQDTFIINNNNMIFEGNERLIIFDLLKKELTEIVSLPIPISFINLSSSNNDNIFYASCYGGKILRFNDSEGKMKRIEKYKEGSDFVPAFPEGIMEIIDDYKRWGVFVAAFSDGRILSIGTDDKQASPFTNDLEIRLYDESGNKIISAPLKLQGNGRMTSDYYFDNIDNVLFIYNNTKNHSTNVCKFDNNLINIQEIPEFGRIVKRVEYNNKNYFVSFTRILGKLFFYNTDLQLYAIMDVKLSQNHEIANVEIIENTIKVYEYLPGK